eukprot:3901403-Amphidinium_carterae.1
MCIRDRSQTLHKSLKKVVAAPKRLINQVVLVVGGASGGSLSRARDVKEVGSESTSSCVMRHVQSMATQGWRRISATQWSNHLLTMLMAPKWSR